MSIPTRAEIKVSIIAQRNGTASYGGGMVAEEVLDLVFNDGTGNSQINRVAQGDAQTVSSGSPVELDLQTLAVPVDTTLGLTALRGFWVRSDAGNDGPIILGFADANGWTDLINATGTVTLEAGAAAYYALPQGYAVGPTNKIVDVTTAEVAAQTFTFGILGVGP